MNEAIRLGVKCPGEAGACPAERVRLIAKITEGMYQQYATGPRT